MTAIADEGRRLGNTDLAKLLLDLDFYDVAQATEVMEVVIQSKETGKVERGRPGFEAYATRCAVDRIQAIRDLVEREVEAKLKAFDPDA